MLHVLHPRVCQPLNSFLVFLNHRIIQSGGNFERSPVQPPAQGRAKTELRSGCQGLGQYFTAECQGQQCWGTTMSNAAFRKLLRSCLSCHCEKVSKDKIVSKQEWRIWSDQQRAQMIAVWGFFPAVCSSWIYLALVVYQQCVNQKESRLTYEFGSNPVQQLRGVRYNASYCSISTVLVTDGDGASLSCCENIRVSCRGEHKHAHRTFSSYFTPAPPLPLIFSLCAAQQSRKPHRSPTNQLKVFSLPLTDSLFWVWSVTLKFPVAVVFTLFIVFSPIFPQSNLLLNVSYFPPSQHEF